MYAKDEKVAGESRFIYIRLERLRSLDRWLQTPILLEAPARTREIKLLILALQGSYLTILFFNIGERYSVHSGAQTDQIKQDINPRRCIIYNHHILDLTALGRLRSYIKTVKAIKLNKIAIYTTLE